MTNKLGALDTAWIDRLKRALATVLQPPSGTGANAAAGTSPAAALPPPAHPVSPAPTPADIDHGARALVCHRTAETHINAALYELDRLRDEVAAVLSTNRGQVAIAPGQRPPEQVPPAAARKKPGIAA